MSKQYIKISDDSVQVKETDPLTGYESNYVYTIDIVNAAIKNIDQELLEIPQREQDLVDLERRLTVKKIDLINELAIVQDALAITTK